MQVNRLFEIIYILLDKKKVTAKELSRHFGVSRRTICRDIDALSLAGIPVYTVRGKGGGVRLLPDFVLDKSILSEEEQLEILLALQGLSNIKMDDTDQILQRLSVIFNKTITNWLEVDFVGWSHENDYFNAVKLAILERRIIQFDYYNSNGEKTFRQVEPIQIRFKSKGWYLKGFCLCKRDVRLYKLSRIKNLVVTDQCFEVRSSLDLSDRSFDEYFNNQENAVIKLRIEPEMAHRVYDDFYEGMVERQPDGYFIVTVTWPQDLWLYNFILSFGSYIEVIEPESLGIIIKNEAKKIFDKYL